MSELRELADAANGDPSTHPRHWYFVDKGDGSYCLMTEAQRGLPDASMRSLWADYSTAAFIAAADPNTVLGLLDEVDRLTTNAKAREGVLSRRLDSLRQAEREIDRLTKAMGRRDRVIAKQAEQLSEQAATP